MFPSKNPERSPRIPKSCLAAAWAIPAGALLCLTPEIPAAPPLREASPNASQPLRLNLNSPTLEQLAQAIREQTGVNLLLAEELRPRRVPDIHLNHLNAADALRALEKSVPGISLEISPGPSGPTDPGTVFHLLPARKSPACQVLSTGPRFAQKKAFQDFLQRATDAIEQACAARSKADPDRPLAPPRMDPHPLTQLLFVSGDPEAVALATQVLVALGCTVPAPPAASAPLLPAPSNIPLPPAALPNPGTAQVSPGSAAPGSPRVPVANPQDPKTAPPTGDRLSEIQAAHAEATRRLRSLEETSRPARIPPTPVSPTPGIPARKPASDR